MCQKLKKRDILWLMRCGMTTQSYRSQNKGIVWSVRLENPSVAVYGEETLESALRTVLDYCEEFVKGER
jgi:hypothetical protein